jgi:MFS family permease
MLAAITSATSLFGPVLAGVVMQLVPSGDSWRALFWINVAVGAVVLPLAFRFIVEPPSVRIRGFDTLGVVLLAPAIVLLIAPLSTISKTTPPAWWMLVAFLIGAGFAVAFVRHEIRLAKAGFQSLVDPLIFAYRHLTSGVIISGLMHAAGTAGTLIITISLQQAAGQTALQTALWMLPSAAAMIIGSMVVARMPQSRGYRLIAIGTGIGGAGLLAIAISFGSVPVAVLPMVVCALLVVNSFGSAFSGPSNQARTLAEVPEHRSSIAASMIQFAQRIGSAIGMAVALIVYYGWEYELVPVTGRPTLGPTVAIAITAGFLIVASIIATLDRERRPRV